MTQQHFRLAPRWAASLLLVLGLAACDVNAVPRQDEAVKAAWSQVLNQYQRRADLIPNLVETVKGYAAHPASKNNDGATHALTSARRWRTIKAIAPNTRKINVGSGVFTRKTNG